MRFTTQMQAAFGGAFFVTEAMGVIRLSPMLARCYLLASSITHDLHVPIGGDGSDIGQTLLVFNEGSAVVRIVNDVEQVVMGTIDPQRMGIVIKVHTGDIAYVTDGPPPVTVHPYAVHERLAY